MESLPAYQRDIIHPPRYVIRTFGGTTPPLLVDGGGHVLTRDEYEGLRSYLDETYHSVSAELIDEINQLIKKAQEDLTPSSLSKTRPTPGIIYIIDVGDGRYKIGRTKNLEKRIEQFKAHARQIGRDDTLDVIRSWSVNDIYEVERRLHEDYAKVRTGGEIFELTKDHLRQIDEDMAHEDINPHDRHDIFGRNM